MKVVLCLIAASLVLLPSLRAEIPGVDDFRAEALKQINAFRASEGQGPVVLDDRLNALSLEWARHLAGEGKMYHRSRADMFRIVGLNGWKAMNENLFMSSRNTSVADTLDAWEHSPGHRRNLLQDNIARIGLGVATGDTGGFYAVFNGAGP